MTDSDMSVESDRQRNEVYEYSAEPYTKYVFIMCLLCDINKIYKRDLFQL